MQKNTFLGFLIFLIIFISGCDSKITTEPSKILPVLKEAQRCCDGHKCVGPYLNISKEAACTDVTQFELCLQGVDAECPLKGYGAF